MGLGGVLSGQGCLDFGHKKNICCAANWRSHKRLSQIIKAFALLPVNDYRLFVVGECSDYNLQALENIIFTGSIQQLISQSFSETWTRLFICRG